MRRQMRPSVSQCALGYTRAIEDPKGAEAACVPANINVASLKIKKSVKGVFNTGTNGVGYIFMSPGRAMTNDLAAVQSTTSQWAGSLASVPYTGDGYGQGTIMPSDYYAALGDEAVQLRIVGAGLYIQNRTPIMNRGAIVYGIESPGHSTLASATSNADASVNTLTQMNADDNAFEVNTDSGQWASIVWHPVAQDELSFASTATTQTVSSTVRSLGNYSLGFSVQASDTTKPQMFCFEAYVLYEAFGSRPGGETLSPSDPQGFAAANTLFQSTAIRQPRIGDRWSKFVSLAEFVARNVPEVLAFVHRLRAS